MMLEFVLLQCLHNAEGRGSPRKGLHEPHGFHKPNKRVIACTRPLQHTSMAASTRPFLKRPVVWMQRDRLISVCLGDVSQSSFYA